MQIIKFCKHKTFFIYTQEFNKILVYMPPF
ncbi:hypothetical protein GGR07_000956 [Bacteroides pyogenes]|nr:hypothetical protein [Bacteroides pyogenes]SUV34935.1 Uncharacterised protein [Bacteroides pyogenes]